MATNRNTSTRFIFYGVWLVVSFFQATCTELLGDEAYYWKYAQELSWGYFDHPPVVALMIKAGWSLLHSELGVRLWFILSSLGFFYILERLTRPKNLALFYITLSSLGIIHFLCLMALPDMPLLFFSASFLYLYKQYENKATALNVSLLAINVALLLLSKYLGILVIGFTVLSNISLLRKKSFWLIAVLSTLLFAPHVYWQFQHGMPSIKYHLFERSAIPYEIEFTLNYLLSSLLILAPITGFVLVWHSFKFKTYNKLDKALKLILIGTPIFFFIMTFKGRAEANWLAGMIIPVTILGYQQCEEKEWFKKFVQKSFAITLLLVVIARAYLVYDYLPNSNAFKLIKAKLHHTATWAADIEKVAEDKPVAFMNKYQHAALYEFYTGKSAISLNNRMGRKNQYNIWKDEQSLQGEEVILIANYFVNGLDSINTTKGSFLFQDIPNFRSASDVRIIHKAPTLTAQANKEIEIEVQLHSIYNTPSNISNNVNLVPTINAYFFKEGKLQLTQSLLYRVNNEMVDTESVQKIKVTTPNEVGDYDLYLDISMGWLPPAINAQKVELTIK